MANRAYESSWADQWDYNSDPAAALPNKEANNKKNSSGIKEKYGKKVGDGFQKTKSVASTGMKKVKAGTSVGLHWIKDKYQKTTQKH